MKIFRKSLSLILALLMLSAVFAVMPISASAEDTDFTYKVILERAVITGYKGTDTEVEIPYEIDDYEVFGIDKYAFANNTSITSVNIHDFVETIGEGAFSGCTNLSEVRMSSNVEYLGKDAFFNTAIYNSESAWTDNVLYLDSVLVKALPSVSGKYEIEFGTMTVGCEAFRDCGQLTEVVLPDTLKYISSDAFLNCKGLKDVTVPNSVTEIDSHAFGYFFEDDAYIRINDFYIYYEKGSVAGSYADQNGFYSSEIAEVKSVNIQYKDPVVGEVMDTTAVLSSNPSGALDVSKVNISHWLMTKTGYLEDAAVPDFGRFGEEMYYMPYVQEFYNMAFLDHIKKGYKASPDLAVTVNGRRIYADKDMLVLTGVTADKFKISGITNKTYTGKLIVQKPTVTYNGKKLKEGVDYLLAYSDNKNVGTSSITIIGEGFYGGMVDKTFKITKANQPMTVKANVKSVKAANAKKTKQTIKGTITVKKAQGTVSYKKVSKGSSKNLTISAKGVVTLKKGNYKKGTVLKLNVKVTAKGNKNYKSGNKTVTVKIKVK